MKMMMMLELAPTPLDLVTELPGDPSSLSLRPSFCSSAIENQRRFSTRKDKLKKRKKRRMAKPNISTFSTKSISMPSFHNEPNQLLGLPWPHPNVPYESLHKVIPAIQGLIDFLPTIEDKFVNLTPSLKQFSCSNQTTHDCP